MDAQRNQRDSKDGEAARAVLSSADPGAMVKRVVLSDGGILGLLAAAIAREAAPAGRKDLTPTLVPWRCEGVAGEYRRKAVQQQAETLRLQLAVKWRPPEPVAGSSTTEISAEVQESLGLVAAVHLSAKLKASALVWPVQGVADPDSGSTPHHPASGLDLDLISKSHDRALLASRLGSLDTESIIGIELPFLDMTDRQVADLAADMELPLQAVWWWGTPQTFQLGVRERERWFRAFESAGWASMMPMPDSMASRAVNAGAPVVTGG